MKKFFWGGGIAPFPDPTPLGAYGASNPTFRRLRRLPPPHWKILDPPLVALYVSVSLSVIYIVYLFNFIHLFEVQPNKNRQTAVTQKQKSTKLSMLKKMSPYTHCHDKVFVLLMTDLRSKSCKLWLCLRKLYEYR